MARPFADREIVLGVTGSIAAYKACEIASRLVEAGGRVIPVLTENARQFVGPVSLEAITRNRAITGMFEPIPSPEIEHIALAKRADLFLIAPATANIIAKAAHGIADDWLSTTLLATRAPILFAPAMNCNMYEHPATQANIQTLRERGAHFAGPGSGPLACGDIGPGRLAETSVILEAAAVLLSRKKDLAGKHVLITSGSTHEAIDPVRFIANRSSGKMGRALALEALQRGARVTVVSGPASAPLPHGATIVEVASAAEMLHAVQEHWPHADIFVAAAAVGDFRVEAPAGEKRKRKGQALTLTLVANEDIAAHVGKEKRPHQITVGFAAETQDLLENALEKLERKNLDLIVANEVGGEDCAFGAETSRATLLTRQGNPEEPIVATKEALSERIFDQVAKLLGVTRGNSEF